MRLIKVSLFAAVLFLLAACGGNGGYSPEKCTELKSKIEKKETLTESDYNEMIDQASSMVKILEAKYKEIGDDKEKSREYFRSEEGKEILTNTLGFVIYLDAHKSELTEGNVKKLSNLQDQLKEMN